MSAGRPKRRDVAMEKKSFALMIMMVFLLTVVHVFAEEIITNETIVTMVKAGLGEELIISKIKTSQNQFDVSTDSILKLKNEGVNENIIKAMIEASKPKVSTPLEPSAVTKMIIANLTNLYLKKDAKMVAIPRIIAEEASSEKKGAIWGWGLGLPSSIYGPEDIWYFIRGEKSVVRTTDKQPAFCTKMNPSAFLLVKLTYQKKKIFAMLSQKAEFIKKPFP
jgi:hypothetical protein